MKKREADFSVIRDGKSWLLAEVKHPLESASAALGTFRSSAVESAQNTLVSNTRFRRQAGLAASSRLGLAGH